MDLSIRVKLGVAGILKRLARELIKSLSNRNDPSISIIGGETIFELTDTISISTQPTIGESMNTRTITLPDDQADFAYHLPKIESVLDTEGKGISFGETFESSDSSVIELKPDDSANGNVHVGDPGTATVVRSVSYQVGRKKVISPVDVTTFIVTTSAAVNVTVADTTFDGVEVDPVEPA